MPTSTLEQPPAYTEGIDDFPPQLDAVSPEASEQLADPTILRRIGSTAMRGVESLKEFRDNHPIVMTVAEAVAGQAAGRVVDAIGSRMRADSGIPTEHADTTIGFMAAGHDNLSDRFDRNARNRGLGHAVLAKSVNYAAEAAANRLSRN